MIAVFTYIHTSNIKRWLESFVFLCKRWDVKLLIKQFLNNQRFIQYLRKSLHLNVLYSTVFKKNYIVTADHISDISVLFQFFFGKMDSFEYLKYLCLLTNTKKKF